MSTLALKTYSFGQVEKVLEAVGVDSSRTGGEDDIMVFCPWHNNRRTPAGEINKNSGIFYCFGCLRVAALEDYVLAVAGIEYFQSLRLIESCRSGDSIVDQIEAALVQPEKVVYDVNMIDTLHANALKSSDALAYFASRQISAESIEKFNLGFSERMGMITIPYFWHDGSGPGGFEGRSIRGKRFLSEGKKSDFLFNVQNRLWTPEVFLTEASLDAIRLEQLGIPAVSSMGVSRSNRQIELLKRYFQRVYIVQDNDPPGAPGKIGHQGQAGAQKLFDKLGKRGIIVRPPRQYKDVGDMSDQEIMKMAEEARDITKGI